MLDLFSVSVVLIRSFAIFLLVQALTIIPSALLFLRREAYPDGSSSSPDLTLAASLISYVVAAALLFAFARKLGALLTRGLERTTIEIDEDNLRVLQRVAFSLLGAYLLVYSLPMVLRMIAVAVLPPIRDDDGGLFRSVSRRHVSLEEAIQIFAQVTLGIWLLLGLKRTVASIRSTWNRLFSVSDASEVH